VIDDPPARRDGTANAREHVWNAAATQQHASRTHHLLTDKLRTHAHQESGHYQKGHLSSARAQNGTFLTHDSSIIVARVAARVWRDTKVAAAALRLNSRPAARLRTSDAHEANHPPPLPLLPLRVPPRLILLPFSSILPLPSLSYRTPSRALARPNRRGCSAPTNAPFIPTTHNGPHRSSLFDVPWRGREGDETPSSRGTTRHSRRRSLNRPTGRLTGWLVGSLAECAWQALLWVTLTHLDLLRASWLRRDQSAWC